MLRTGDGYDIAYTTVGAGMPFVFFPNHFAHVEIYCTPGSYVSAWIEGLAARFRTVVFDGRGQGMSTRGLREAQTLETV